jgi:hypothetical protein
MNKNTNKILLIIVIVLALILVGLIAKQVFWGSTPSYYAVYLRTGELYFGKLSLFPSFKLTNVYLLQVNAQNSENPVSIQKFSNVFWGPENYIKINKDEVVWYTKISPQSQLINFFEGKMNQSLGQNNQAPRPNENLNNNASNNTGSVNATSSKNQ